MDRIEGKLDNDILTYVISLLDTPKDLANAACVCYTWHKCVIEGELWRKLCIKVFPEIGRIYRKLKVGGYLENPYQSNEITYVQAKSCPYGLLLKKLLLPPLQRTCISEPLHASSTDNLPEESIAQTLYPEPFYSADVMPSCWSSQGEESRDVPETLTYRLVSDLCVVYSVKVQPYLVYYQEGNPIYSSEMVRFRFGYSQSPKPHWKGLSDCFSQRGAIGDYVWTYVSPTFPMRQENVLQTFELPIPTLCIGGVLQIELIGRVQTQRSDGLYYIGVNHVNVIGRPLSYLKFDHEDEEGQYSFRPLSPEEACSTALDCYKFSPPDFMIHNSVAMLNDYLVRSELHKDNEWVTE